MSHSIYPIAVVFVLCTLSCGARQPSGDDPPEVGSSSDDPGAISWQAALFPEQEQAKVQRGTYGRHVALFYGGRVYASNGNDLPTEVGSALLPLALRREPHQGKRWAFVGIGSGVEVSVALNASPAQVDLYEPSAELMRGAAGLSDVSGLLFVEGRPQQDRLNIISQPPEGAPPEGYDLIVHPSSMTVISHPSRLYTVERFEALRDLLAPGGQVVIHLQAYEIRPITYQTLLRTFAAAFPHVTVMTPEDLSSDSLLIGSLEPSAVDLEVVRGIRADRSLSRFFFLSKLARATDVACRALLIDRNEIARYVGDGSVFRTTTPMDPDEVQQRPPQDPTQDIDDWDTRFDSWLAQTGLAEYEHFVETFYSPDWPYGDPCPDVPSCRFVTGIGEGREAAAAYADLALSLMAHGRLDASRVMLERTAESFNDPEGRIIRSARVYQELFGSLSLEGAPRPESERARLAISNVTTPEVAAEHLRPIFGETSIPIEDRQIAEVYLHYHQCQLRGDPGEDAMRRLERFVDEEPSFIERHTSTLYLLGRCQRSRFIYDRAVDTMLRYVDMTSRERASGAPTTAN